VKTNEVIGILGGMGPAATADFYAKLVASTHVLKDQDHPRVVIWADPAIPDRTEALLDGGEDPTPWMLRGIKILAGAGATMVAIPCNTAHAFIPSLADKAGLPIIHMIGEVARELAETTDPVTRIGLLATTGTCRTGLYQDWMDKRGIEVLLPDGEDQDTVMMAIRAVKSGQSGAHTQELFARIAHRLVQSGAQAIVAGCTEIPLALHADSLPVPLIDPALVLARAILTRVGIRDEALRSLESSGA
jgi:aspartate racemase